MLLAEAIPLESKSHLAILGAARKSWVTVRSLGHRGCAVDHYVWDRAGFSASELRHIGLTAKLLKEGGFKELDVKAAGFNTWQMREAGWY